ncbi:CapA family protein [Natronococcus roseus]|uniref:CapA family protein n=1 Tax=Natronococcus roseus TaxID=1052014 RepID=UPI00374D0B22
MDIRSALPSITGSATDSWSLFFAGDCQLASDWWTNRPIDRSFRERIESNSLAVANLEAPIPVGDPIPKYGPALSIDDHTPRMLSECGFDAVSLANNHAMDYGVDGVRRTIDVCNEAGLRTVGWGRTEADAIEPLELSVGDVTIALFSLCEREFGVATRGEPGTGWIRAPGIRGRIERASKAFDVVVLSVHGGIEYVPLPPPSWRRHLRSLVDAGADVVVGHHPHTPQGWEHHDGSPIVYSLGNWLMCTDGQPDWTLALELEGVGDELTTVRIAPAEHRDGKVTELRSERSSVDCRAYLTDSTEILNAADGYERYWQVIANRVFLERYDRHLEDYGTGRTGSLGTHPRLALDRAIRGVVGDAVRRERELTLQNYFQNESHRDVITTALALHTGTSRDRRTRAVRRTVDELSDLMEPSHQVQIGERVESLRTIHHRLR